MKKTLLLLIHFILCGFLSHSLLAFQPDDDPDINLNLCRVLSIKDYKSHFTSEDQTLTVVLRYSAVNNAVTGLIRQTLNDESAQASFIESHCNNGLVQLVWLQPKFYGAVVGYIDLINRRISRVTGVINGKPVNTYFAFSGYGV